jgi:hypothetical protein
MPEALVVLAPSELSIVARRMMCSQQICIFVTGQK